MKLIGLLDGKPVYEFDRGQYVIVSPESGRWMVTWLWSGYLGRNFDTFKKCSECDDDEKCVEIIEKNKEDILSRLNRVSKNIEDGEESLSDQDKFYDSLEDGKTYSWDEGYIN